MSKGPTPSSAALLPFKKVSLTPPLYEVHVETHQIPVVYREEYNISVFGLEKLHPFDAGKWGKVVQLLKEQRLLVDEALVRPHEATNADLLKVHKQRYIRSLKWSVNVAKITEVAAAALLPNCLLQRKLLRPFRYQTGGSVLAARLAVENGWCINIGGGFHHCSAGRGGGFCAYADITLAVTIALEHYEQISRVLIVDLDAHQGNGYERDFMGRRDIYILDVYNRLIYPKDEQAKQAISKRVELSPFTEDGRYLEKVQVALQQALVEFDCHFVVYNAGTDVLEDDPLGLLSITKQGIISRDEMVWRLVRARKVPLMMLTSGGYQRSSAVAIADSIANLHHAGLIDLKPATVVSALRHEPASTIIQISTSKPGEAMIPCDEDGGKKHSTPSSSSPPPSSKYFLPRFGGSGRKNSSIVSISESSTPLSGRRSTTDSTTSSPLPPATQTVQTEGQQLPSSPVGGQRIDSQSDLSISSTLKDVSMSPSITGDKSPSESYPLSSKPSTNTLQQQPPKFIDISLVHSEARHSIVSPDSVDYGTPRSTLAASSHTISSPQTDSSAHASPLAEDGIRPSHHQSLESTLSRSFTTTPSQYESADSINLSGSLVSNSVFIPP